MLNIWNRDAHSAISNVGGEGVPCHLNWDVQPMWSSALVKLLCTHVQCAARPREKKHVQCAEKLYACMLSPLLGGGTMPLPLPLPLPPPLSRVMNEAEEMGRGLLCWGGGGNHIRDFSTLTFFCSQRCVLTRQNTFVVTNNSFGESCISSKGAPQKLLSGFFPLTGRMRGGTPQFAKKKQLFLAKKR